MIVVGWILLAVGALVTSVMIVGTIVNPTDLGGAIAATLLFGNAPLITGAVLVRTGRKRRRRRLMESTEQLLLAIARKNNGNLTATLVAMETPLSIDEAREVLELFVKHGVVDMVIDDNGTVIYHFRELMVGNQANYN